ncbi:Protein trafficking PGA2 domain containing protein [Elaphomyces granulatus]|jgi:hypothetical protein
MSSQTAAATPDDVWSLLHEFTSKITIYFSNAFRNLHASVTTPSTKYWLRLCVIVCGYIMIRPLIDMFFRKSFERTREKEAARKREQEEAFNAPGKKAKMSANTLRTPGMVIGEVDTEDEEEINRNNGSKATGIPSWGTSARKRQNKFLNQEAKRREKEMTDEQLLELLDWSESDENGKDK